MTYDPYSAGQADYYQDPYQGGGFGYDGYGGDGYDGYEEPYTPTPLPAPDKNWIDPVKANREYLKKIQKSCIHEGFEGLKEDGLFLFEVLARSVSLKKDVYKSLLSTDKGFTPFMTFFKFLDTPFVEVNNTEKASSITSSGSRRSSLLTNKSFTNLFQSIYSSTGVHDSKIPDVENETDAVGDEERNKNQSKDNASESLKTENPDENNSTQIEEMETIKIMKGKSVLLPMPGLSMIQKLQQYPLILKVTQSDVIEEANVEGDILATSFISVPETFRKAVLISCKPESLLPTVAVTTNKHLLMDPQGWEVGDAELTLVLTCFGKGAVNCVSETEDSHYYDHTFLLRHLKPKHVTKTSLEPAVDPRLAKAVLKLGLFLPSQKTSSEILQDCISSNLLPTDAEDLKLVQKKRDCSWFHMLKKAYPTSSHSFDFEMYEREMEMERVALWKKLKQICRDLKTKESVPKKSLEDRFKEVQIVQTGVTGVETHNPFEELAQHSVSGASLRSSASKKSANGNVRKQSS